ncbi:MAG: hypothetical protein ACOCZV_00470 [Nanoarchaeota archaeon]
MNRNGRILIAVTAFFMLVLSLSACQTMGRYQQDSYQETDYNTGTEGIEAVFLEQAPPQSVFEDGEFDVQAKLHNRGSFDLDENNYSMTMFLKYDSSSVRMIQGERGGRYGQLDQINIYGKSSMLPEGEKIDMPIGLFEARSLRSNFETDSSRFVLNYCYPYKTVFSESVCIDANTQEMDARRQVCSAQDHTYSGGQGGPVGVTAVQSEMIPVGDYVKPQFTIRLEQYGDGYVSQFNLADDGTGAGTCGKVNESTINIVNVEAFLGNDTLACRPLEVKFEDGEAEVQCQLDNSDILGVKTSYFTELHVELSYLYHDKTSDEMIIKRSGDPVFYSTQNQSEEKCLPWQERYEGECISKCEYYARMHEYAEFESLSKELTRSSTPWSIEYSPLSHIDKKSKQEQDVIYDSMDCIYDDMSECRKADGDCIPAQGLCFPETYCGWPSCVDSNQRPSVNSLRREGDSIVWQCYDPDSSKDVKQTCGCSEKAYYAFVDHDVLDTNTHCNSLSHTDYEEIEGRMSDVYGMMYEVPISQAEPDKDRVCVKVVDKLGKSSTSSLPITRRN